MKNVKLFTKTILKLNMLSSFEKECVNLDLEKISNFKETINNEDIKKGLLSM